MSAGITYNVSVTGEAETFLKGLRAKLTDRHDLNGAIAGEVRRVILDNFIRKDAQPNKSGWPSLHFFEKFAQRTKIGAISNDSAQIVIGDPDRALARKLNPNAGPITPRESKFLAIPARSEAYGKTPRGFNDLFPIIFKSGAGALVQREQTGTGLGGKTRKGFVPRGQSLGGLVFYWLVKSANPPPDPSALPPAASLEAAVFRGAKSYLEGLALAA